MQVPMATTNSCDFRPLLPAKLNLTGSKHTGNKTVISIINMFGHCNKQSYNYKNSKGVELHVVDLRGSNEKG